MRMPPYLLLRPSGYYFRYTIPHDLRARIGKSEIRKSLCTHDRRAASPASKWIAPTRWM